MQYAARLTPATPTVHASRDTRTRAVRARTTDSAAAMHTVGAAAVGLLIVATVVVAILTLTVHPAAPEPEAWTSISVGPNDSVWAVAAAHPVQGRSTHDTVELICSRNNLASATVHPGQTLLVPGVSASQTALAQR